jgi:hypothetical protein
MKVNQPMTHRKGQTLSKPWGAVYLREKLGERSADRPSGSRCKGGTISAQAPLRNT